jgi:hypothetical protein
MRPAAQPMSRLSSRLAGLDTRGRWTLWAATRALGVLVVLTSPYITTLVPSSGLAGDVLKTYAHAAGAIHSGAVPYRDFAYEYPPGTLPFVLPWPHLHALAYLCAFTVEMLILDAAVVVALHRSPLPGSAAAARLWIAGGACTLGLQLCRNDLPSCLAVVMGLLALAQGRRMLSAAALALGALAKIWPIELMALTAVLVPRALKVMVTAVGAAALAVLVPAEALGALPGLWRDLVGYHGGRGVEVESVAATPTLLWAAVSGRYANLSNDHGSTNLAHSVALGQVCTVIGVVAVVGLLTWCFTLRRRCGVLPLNATIVACCLLVDLSLVTSKVFSAQYMLWLLAVTAAGRACGAVDRVEARILVGAIAATTLVFPVDFFFVGDGGITGLVPALVLVARDVALLVLARRWYERLRALTAPVA